MIDEKEMNEQVPESLVSPTISAQEVGELQTPTPSIVDNPSSP